MKHVGILMCVCAICQLIWVAAANIKTDNTYRNRILICNAIRDYQFDCIQNRTVWKVDYTDMEDFGETDKRWEDWGYTNILPKEKFELIKPFIKEEGKCKSREKMTTKCSLKNLIQAMCLR